MPGLYKCPDGRWRISATGAKFTEPDERRAVARFLTAQQAPTVPVPSRLKLSRLTQDDEGFPSGMILKAETLADPFWP